MNHSNIAGIFNQSLHFLRENGFDQNEEARSIVRLLLDAVTNTRHAHLMQPQRVLNDEEWRRFHAWLGQAAQGRPLPYILGRREFFGLEFVCDERALIPRPETELLVETALQKLSEIPRPKLADLGTGSGCIAVSLAHALPNAEVFASDVSPPALQLAQQNALRHNVKERIHFVAGESSQWAAPLREFAPFDLIVSNPPYIPDAEIETLQREVRDYEPRTALSGGDDGLDCYRAIAAQCKVLARPGTWMLLELGISQFDAVRELFETHNWQVEAPIPDFQNIARVLSARSQNHL